MSDDITCQALELAGMDTGSLQSCIADISQARHPDHRGPGSNNKP